MELLNRMPKWLWWPISGLFLLLPFLQDVLWPLIPIGLGFWLLAISQSGSWKQVTIGSFVVGLGKYAGGIFWFWETYPLPGAVMLEAWKQLLMIGYFWLPMAGSMALGLCLTGLITFYLLRSYKLMFFWPALFIAGEIISSFFFAVFTFGPGSYLNANFSFGYAGLPLAGLPIVFLTTAFFGLYGLSFLAAVGGLLLFLFLKTDEMTRVRLSKISLGVLSLLLVSYFAAPPRPSEPMGLKVIAIETRFDKKSFDDPEGLYYKREAMIDAANLAIQIPSDIVLMPEDARLTENTASIPNTLDALITGSAKTKLLVDTFRSEDLPDQAVLRAVYYDLENATTTYFDKQYMVPIGEYLMNFETWSLGLFGQPEILAHLTRNQNYVPGPINRDQALRADLPGLLFCFENTAPLSVRHIMERQETPLVLHPISHGWFHNPDIFWQQTDAMLQIQAIWSNATIVSAGNMSPSKVYYPDGSIATGKEIHATKYWRLVEYNL